MEELREILAKLDLRVVSVQGKMISLESGYTIEVENEHLYKLLHNEMVIAPFRDELEMGEFIKMDMQLNEEN